MSRSRHRNGSPRGTRHLVAVLALLVATPAAALQNGETPDLEELDGSYELETGEIVTGGYMVEGEGFWIFADVWGLDRFGIFEREGDELRSTFPPDEAIRIEFARSPGGSYDRLVWREGARELQGRRVYPHDSRPVEFSSADGTRIRGRLLVPRCDGPHPGIVMVHGSGPANRYGGVFHTFLLQRGVAVLAYDKRGYTPDPESWREPDLADMSADAAAGVEYLARRPEIAADRVGLWGSSQGGWTAPPAALEAPHTAYMILRAGAALTEAETVLHEVRQELRLEGLHGLDLDYAVALRREIYRLAMEGAPIAAADSASSPYVDEAWYRTAFGDGPIGEIWSDRWWGWAQRNLAVESASAVAEFEGPVLWFLGERDEAVPYIATRTALEGAFAKAPGDDHELVVVEDAPHSFMISADDAPSRYAEGVFSGMADWLEARGFTDPSCWDR